jgi:hypothetical protein
MRGRYANPDLNCSAMTDYEQNLIQRQFSADVDNAERDLNIRRAQVLRLESELCQVCGVLRNNATARPSGEDCLAGPPISQQLPELTYRPILDYSAIIAALEELKRARIRLRDALQIEALARGRNSVNSI